MTLADLLRDPRHIIVATFPDGDRETVPGRHYTEADATRHLPHVKNMLNGRYRYADLDVQMVAPRRRHARRRRHPPRCREVGGVKRPGTSLRTRQQRAAAARVARGERPARLTNDRVLTIYAALRGQGLKHLQIAVRLQCDRTTLDYHLARGRAAGDPRASVPRATRQGAAA